MKNIFIKLILVAILIPLTSQADQPELIYEGPLLVPHYNIDPSGINLPTFDKDNLGYYSFSLEIFSRSNDRENSFLIGLAGLSGKTYSIFDPGLAGRAGEYRSTTSGSACEFYIFDPPVETTAAAQLNLYRNKVVYLLAAELNLKSADQPGYISFYFVKIGDRYSSRDEFERLQPFCRSMAPEKLKDYIPDAKPFHQVFIK